LTDGGPEPREESIAETVRRLIEDARAYAEAEIALLKAIAAHRAERARKALVALAIGWFCLFAAMTALVITALVRLSLAVGPLLAGLIVGVPLAAVGYWLVRRGWREVKGLTEDSPEEKAALRDADPMP
jgi:hypothetical protein